MLVDFISLVTCFTAPARDKFYHMTVKLSQKKAQNAWIHAQCLDHTNPFGKGAVAVTNAVNHLGYVQIDTINVIERCHHHILFNRIPGYERRHLREAQTDNKTIFEYWTHALSYVATADYKYFVGQMKNINTLNGSWFSTVTAAEYRKVKNLISKEGPISIRDIKDDVPVEKTHAWGSTKPSKKALQLGFYRGEFVIGERDGMLKKYELTDKHFGWDSRPAAATEREYSEYILNRALKAQGLVSLDSVCHLDAKQKPKIEKLIESLSKTGKLVEVEIQDAAKIRHWARPEFLDEKIATSKLTHILSPFDPLIIQRKRLKLFFDYEHLFEAYIPKERRKFGYFTLPVLMQNKIVALLDLKTDRINKKLLVNNWIWREKNKSAESKILIEQQLHRFENFQLS